MRAEIRAGAAYAHSLLAIEEMKKARRGRVLSGRLAGADQRALPDWIVFDMFELLCMRGAEAGSLSHGVQRRGFDEARC